MLEKPICEIFIEGDEIMKHTPDQLKLIVVKCRIKKDFLYERKGVLFLQVAASL